MRLRGCRNGLEVIEVETVDIGLNVGALRERNGTFLSVARDLNT